MAERYLELAALATAAVGDLDLVEGTEYSYGVHGDFDSALLKDSTGRLLIVRRPTSPAAAQEQRADVRALEAVTAGVRSLLPFAIPVVVGVGRAGEEAVVTEFVPGEKADRLPLEPGTLLVSEIGRTVASVHDLPRSFVEDAGLPSLDAVEIREAVDALVTRATRTGRVPVAIERRWTDAVDDASLWQFQPTVVHGSLGLGSMITNGLGIVGVLGWGDLRVGDPARDLHWAQSLDPRVLRSVLDEYTDARSASVDRQIRRRAALYSELEIARWLLYGVDGGDDAVVADAESMLDALVDRVNQAQAGPVVHETLPVLDLEGVQELLGQGPVAEPGVRPSIDHRDPGAHPDDDGIDLDHAARDDLDDDTPPNDFLRDDARSVTGPIIGVDDDVTGAASGADANDASPVAPWPGTGLVEVPGAANGLRRRDPARRAASGDGADDHAEGPATRGAAGDRDAD
ncbi:aminoglycoside phosphotransferase (APT) family kinase protein [Pseudoclavibacter chungangensis]|uniref:phosphotransferase n=1 Tax=Pseudoclavibacter chungangensis TaxID=587635 RepID=UPI0015C6EC78|nr:phosphotransferase [Pseudoclavibacter chungangensis]NYJ66124.1 aminoglycoside phosphotransferase (APT) family kinase protein [Pseudoclavibacter chungangensis]